MPRRTRALAAHTARATTALTSHPSPPSSFDLASLPPASARRRAVLVPVLLSLDLWTHPTFRIHLSCPPPTFLPVGARPRSRTPMVRGRGRGPNRPPTPVNIGQPQPATPDPQSEVESGGKSTPKSGRRQWQRSVGPTIFGAARCRENDRPERSHDRPEACAADTSSCSRILFPVALFSLLFPTRLTQSTAKNPMTSRTSSGSTQPAHVVRRSQAEGRGFDPRPPLQAPQVRGREDPCTSGICAFPG
jgi:hypothetical protein